MRATWGVLFFSLLSFSMVFAAQDFPLRCQNYNASANVEYILQSDVITSDPDLEPCVNFTNSINLTINGNGKSFSPQSPYVNSYYMSFYNVTNLKIYNISINSGGVEIQNCKNVTIDSVNIHTDYYSGLSGVVLVASSSINISNSVIVSGENTISGNGAEYLTVYNCTITGVNGISTHGTTELLVQKNNFDVSNGAVTSSGYQTLVDSNIINMHPDSGYALGLSFLGPGIVTASANFIVTNYTDYSQSCVTQLYGIRAQSIPIITLLNNVIQNVFVNMAPNSPCQYTPLWGGIYTTLCPVVIIDGADISLGQGGPSPVSAITTGNGFVLNLNVGIAVQQATTVNISTATIHDIQGGSKGIYENITDLYGLYAAGLYIDANETYLSTVIINGVYGGNSGMAYNPTATETYNFGGGWAFGIFVQNGNITASGIVTIDNIHGGTGFDVPSLPIANKNCIGGYAYAVYFANPQTSKLQGSTMVQRVTNGSTCAAPSTGTVIVTKCGQTYNAFLNGNVIFSGYMVFNIQPADCLNVPYVSNVTFYGNGSSIVCTFGCQGFGINLPAAENVVFINLVVAGQGISYSGKNAAIYNSTFNAVVIGQNIAIYTAMIGYTTLSISGNTFYNFRQSTIEFNVSLAIYNFPDLHVENNQFYTSLWTAVSTNSTTFSDNQIYSPPGVFTVATNSGEIRLNVIDNGSFAVLFDGSNLPVTRLVDGNTVQNLRTSETGTSFGIYVTTVTQNNISIQFNTVKNVTVGCGSHFYGFWLPSIDSLSLSYNNVTDIFGEPVTSCASIPYIAAYEIEQSQGFMSYSEAHNIHGVSFNSPNTLYQVDLIITAISVVQSTISVIGCTFDNFHGPDGQTCEECTDASAKGVAGITVISTLEGVYIPTLVDMKTCKFTNFYGGNGGNISSVGNSTGGANVYGIYDADNATIFVSFSNYDQFIAGNNGYFPGESPLCSLGESILIQGSTPLLTNVNWTNHYGRSECLGGFPTPNPTQIPIGPTTGGGSSVPSPPNNVTFSITRTSVTLKWSAPSPNLGKRATPLSYAIDLSEDGLNWTNEYTGPALTYTIQNLAPNTTYQIAITTVGSGLYLNYTIKTLPPSVPAQPDAPNYKEFSRTFISLIWTPPSDDGGFPLLNYTLQILNSTGWATLYFGNQTSYTLTNLTMDSDFLFRLEVSNKLGTSAFSQNATISTAPSICGDGLCDFGDSCSTCFLDCGSCGYPACPHACNARGTCEKGVCVCNSGYSGSACDLADTPVIVQINDTTPVVIVSPSDGGQNKQSQNARFLVGFNDIQEVSPDGKILSRFSFAEQIFNVTPGNSPLPGVNTSIYTSTLPNKAILVVYLSTFGQDTQVPFANTTIPISANGIKYAFKISNWPFQAFVNKLKVTMASQGESDKKSKDDCVSVNSSKDQSNNLQWLQISLNGVLLYAKFAEIAIIDSVIKSVQFAYNQTSSLIEITIPHFWDTAEFDPDFQVLFSKDLVHAGCKKNSNAGKVAGITVGVVGGVAIFAALVIYIISKRRSMRTRRRLRSKVPLSDLSGKNSSASPLYSKE